LSIALLQLLIIFDLARLLFLLMTTLLLIFMLCELWTALFSSSVLLSLQ
jgi:hypothetical protein